MPFFCAQTNNDTYLANYIQRDENNKLIMKQITPLLTIIILITLSCNPNNSNDSTKESQTDSIETRITRVYPPDTVVLNFLVWYRDNYEKTHPFYIVTEKNDSSIIHGKWGDSTTYYSVNFKGTEMFLQFLNSSRCLSPKYLENKRTSFKERAAELAEYKQWDGPPDGFSAEEIFYLNDLEEYFPKISKAKITDLIIKGDSASCKVDIFEGFRFKLSKYNNGKWLIDEIEL
jgi:hypothetical protein